MIPLLSIDPQILEAQKRKMEVTPLTGIHAPYSSPGKERNLYYTITNIPNNKTELSDIFISTKEQFQASPIYNQFEFMSTSTHIMEGTKPMTGKALQALYKAMLLQRDSSIEE